MSTQGKVQFRSGYALEESGVVSNVATNKAEMELWKDLYANVDGKQISPSEVYARRADFAEGLTVDGASILMADGVIKARHLVQTEEVITQSLQVGNAVITPDAISLPGGEISALSANLGTITAGILNIQSGNLDIGTGADGINILGGLVLNMKSGGQTKISLNATTGIITAKDLVLTASSGNSLNLSAGSHTFSDSITVGTGRTLGDLIRTYAQTTQPTGTMKTGDIWIDTSTAGANRVKRWSGSAWVDLRDSGVTDLAANALKYGGGVAMDTDHYIITIDLTSGIQIYTSTASSRTQITANGIAIYSGGYVKVQADQTNGVTIVNSHSATPGMPERLSFGYGTTSITEAGYMYAYSTTQVVLVATGNFTIQAPTYFPNYQVWAQQGVVFGGTGAPTIKSGAAPTQGGASTEPQGSLRLATGGSLWLTNSSGVWDRIYAKTATSAVAHS